MGRLAGAAVEAVEAQAGLSGGGGGGEEEGEEEENEKFANHSRRWIDIVISSVLSVAHIRKKARNARVESDNRLCILIGFVAFSWH